jgi:glycosyltransferase involved in cell wall biosynthesis
MTLQPRSSFQVSICVPAYNAQATLAATLSSIVAQSYRDLDIVVVDNASSDATPDIVRDFAQKDPRVRLLRFEELVHGHDNFTRCIWAARGELMAIYHADDIYHPTIVADQVALLRQHADIGAVFTKGRRIDGEGVPLPSPFPIPHSIFNGAFAQFDFADGLKAVLQYGHIFLTPSGMARTKIYREEIRRWPNPDFGGSADLFVFLTIARRHKIAVLNKTLIDYRTSAVSHSFRYARERRSRHDMFQTLGHFVAQDAAVLGPDDLANYEFLQLKDDTNIAISCLIDGERGQARALMPRLARPRIIAAALRYHRHGKFLIAGYGAWVLSFFPLGAVGRRLLNRLRFG